MAEPPQKGEQDTEQALVDLQVRVTYQDKVIADLDEVVRAFSNRVEVLERRIVELEQRVEAGEPEVGPQDDPPPHY